MENGTTAQYQIEPELLVTPRSVRLKKWVIVVTLGTCLLLSPVLFMVTYIASDALGDILTCLFGRAVTATVEDKWTKSTSGGDGGQSTEYVVVYRYSDGGDSRQGQSSVNEEDYEHLDVARESRIPIRISPFDANRSIIASGLTSMPIIAVTVYLAFVTVVPTLFFRRLAWQKWLHSFGTSVTATLSAKVERKDEDSLGQCFWTCSIPNSSGHLVAYTHQESVTQREFEERKVGDFRTLLYDPKYPTRRIFYDDGDYEVVPQNR